MRAMLLLLVHLLSRVIRLLETRGARAVLAESLLLKHQLLVVGVKNPIRPRTRYFPGDCRTMPNIAQYARTTRSQQPTTRHHRLLGIGAESKAGTHASVLREALSLLGFTVLAPSTF
jgi:hypothetical protein